MRTEKNIHFAAGCVVFVCMVLQAAGICSAMDRAGCLTCHKYPGLVRQQNSPNEIQVFHIDEDAYLKSAHGKVGCKKCHSRIVKVPHTGGNHVDCTKECHLGAAERKRVAGTPLGGFHAKEQSYITRLDDDSSCRACHPLYPHHSNNMVRALLNMHTGFMRCEVCHIKKENFDRLSYDWITSEKAEFSGKPYGSFFNPKMKKAVKSQDFVSRIAAFKIDHEKKMVIMDGTDVKKAKQFLRNKETHNPEGIKESLEYFHRDTAKKEISVACNECHGMKGILDFKALGFDGKRAYDLVCLNIKGLVTKYETFYFPNLFGQ